MASANGRGKVIPGFLISDQKKSIEHGVDYEDMIQESLRINDWFVSRRTYKRFLGDKTLYCDDDCCIVLEGVILNKKELLGQYHVDSIEILVKEMYRQEGENFFRAFRGSFSGAYYNVASSSWVVWTNHYGNNAVFYSIVNGHFSIGSNFWDVLKTIRSHSSISLNERAVISMLSYGGMNDDLTYVNEVKRLLPGSYLHISASGECSIKEYWHFSHSAFDLSCATEDELISELDARFRHAVDRQFGKDEEYGFRHLAELSGGLDSRMITWIARDLGYSNITNITFCQAGYIDENVAEEIATDLGNQMMFMPMDDATFLRDIEGIVRLNFGLTVYSGTTGLKRFLDNINIDDFGLIHSGTLGDAVASSYLHDPSELGDVHVGGLYSPYYSECAREITDLSMYDDQEEYLMRTRGFLTIATSDLVRRGYSDVASPFLDIDFFEYCMSIPLKYRCNHLIYKKWVCSKYPAAAKYVWEKQGTPLTAGRLRVWLTTKWQTLHAIGVKGAAQAVLYRLGIGGSAHFAPTIVGGMNPIDLWFKVHPELKSFYDDCFERGVSAVKLSNRVFEMLIDMYKNGTYLEKSLTLTALHAIRKIFIDE